MATAAGDKVVPVSLCIIFKNFKVTSADLLEVKNICAHENKKKQFKTIIKIVCWCLE